MSKQNDCKIVLQIDVLVGELADKITLLQKSERLPHSDQLANEDSHIAC